MKFKYNNEPLFEFASVPAEAPYLVRFRKRRNSKNAEHIFRKKQIQRRRRYAAPPAVEANAPVSKAVTDS